MPNNQPFYDSGDGDSLADETELPAPILRYVRLESELVKKILSDFDSLIEIGCMWGRLGEVARQLNKPYLGIDICPRYIDLAKSRFGSGDQFSFDCCDATDPACPAVEMFREKWKLTDPLLVLPFNCIGNMERPTDMIDQIERWQMNSLIFGYQDGPWQVGVLAEYFSKSGLGHTGCSENKNEISFNSSSGFRSLLLRKSWFTTYWKNSYSFDLGDMLRCWTNFGGSFPRIEFNQIVFAK